MAEYDWLGIDGAPPTDPVLAVNWDPGTGPPGTGDSVDFDGGGNNACTLTANWALANLTTVPAYTAKLDLATFDLTMDTGGDIILDQGGEFDCGTGTISLSNATFDWKHVAAFTRGTSTVVMSGTGNLVGSTAKDLHALTIAIGAATTVSESVECQGVITIEGTLSVAPGKVVRAPNDTALGASGHITGNGEYSVYFPGNGKGISAFEFGAVVDVATLSIVVNHAGAVLAAGTYAAGVVRFSNGSAVARSFALSGNYTFTGDVELKNTSAGGSLTIANDTNNPTITVEGDVIWDEQAGDPGIIYNPSSNPMTASGLVDQALDFGGQASEDLEIDKDTSGDVELTDCDLELTDVAMAGNLTVTGSTLTASSDAKTIDGDVDWSDAGNDISCGSGTVWTIGGDFDFSAIGTLTRETATFVLTGNAPNTLAGASGVNPLYKLTFDTSSSYQVTESGGMAGGELLCKSGATVDIATGKFLLGGNNSDVQIQSGVTISRTGTGYFRLFNADVTQQDGEISAECRVQVNSSLVGGNYSGLLWFQEAGVGNRTMTLTGAFTVGSLEFETTGSGNVTIDCTGLTAMTVAGNTTIDMNGGGGDITVNNTGNSAAWVFQGDVINEVDGDTFLWTKGSSVASITASGGNAQNWDWMGQTLEAVTVNKSANTLTFSGGWTADSFTAIDGELDFNEQTVETTGGFTITGDATVVADADAMNGAAITVGGDFLARGNPVAGLLNLKGTAEWTLNVTGSSRAVMADIAYCNASAGVPLIAYGCTDSGNNSSNVIFKPLTAATGINYRVPLSRMHYTAAKED